MGEAAGKVFRSAQHVRQARRDDGQRPVPHEIGLRLHLARDIALGGTARVVPRIARVDRLRLHGQVALAQRLRMIVPQRAISVDGGRHHVAPHPARERAHGDGRVQRVVAHLVVHDVERAEAGERVAHRGLVAAVDAHARDPVAERVGRIAARRDGDAMAGAQQALHEQLADITGTTDHQDILGHEVFLSLWARLVALFW